MKKTLKWFDIIFYILIIVIFAGLGYEKGKSNERKRFDDTIKEHPQEFTGILTIGHETLIGEYLERGLEMDGKGVVCMEEVCTHTHWHAFAKEDVEDEVENNIKIQGKWMNKGCVVYYDEYTKKRKMEVEAIYRK